MFGTSRLLASECPATFGYRRGVLTRWGDYDTGRRVRQADFTFGGNTAWVKREYAARTRHYHAMSPQGGLRSDASVQYVRALLEHELQRAKEDVARAKQEARAAEERVVACRCSIQRLGDRATQLERALAQYVPDSSNGQ